MSLGTIVLIVLILLLIGAVPSWPHSRGWGYGPSGVLGLVVVVLLVLLLTGRLGKFSGCAVRRWRRLSPRDGCAFHFSTT